VGEWYWNFGPLGVWLGTALWGWLTTRFRNASQRSSMMLVWSALCFAAMTIHVRNTIGFPLRFAVWSAVGLWVFLRLARALARPQPVSLAEPDGRKAASGMDAAARARADVHP
jgi:MFS-type transporter involved in bile tolerance (Atg22 family)